MIWFDVTRISRQAHHSGLVRTSRRLWTALAEAAPDEVRAVAWHARRRGFVDTEDGRAPAIATGDWIFTPELFSEADRPGFTAWLQRRPCRLAALYHDAIPLRFPEITWPHSVARHPHYLKLLAGADRVFANSEASADELAQYWRWLGVQGPAPVPVRLGADGHGRPRATYRPDRSASRLVLMIGILEPRKNQKALLDAAERLWDEGIAFSLELIGRVNPHFGAPIADRIRRMRRRGRPLNHLARADDTVVERSLEQARFTVLPSLAEGCGLPVLESLWAGVPVIASDLPALRENAHGGGVRLVKSGDEAALSAALREWLADEAVVDRFAQQAAERPLPCWSDLADQLRAALA